MPVERQKPEPSQKRRFSDQAVACETVIGASVLIRGEVRGAAGIELSGAVEGNLDLDGFLWLRPGARIQGSIVATSVLVEGEVTGDISARDKIELRSSCRVHGDLRAQSLAIAEGGFFEGRIMMAGQPGAREQVTFQERRAGSG